MNLIFAIIVVKVSYWQISNAFVFPDQLDELNKSATLHKSSKMDKKEPNHTITSNAAQVTISGANKNNPVQNRASKRISQKSESIYQKYTVTRSNLYKILFELIQSVR